MICPACQAESPAESLFCPKCGQKLAASGTAETNGPSKAAVVRSAMAANAAAGAAASNQPPEVLWEGNYSPQAMIGYWMLAALVTVAGLIVSLLVWLPPVWIGALVLVALVWLWGGAQLVYQKLSVSYRLNAQSFVHQHGILHRVTDRIDVIDMDDISYTQGLLQRFLGLGTLTIISSDISNPKLVLPGVADVEKVAAIFDSARRRERARRGIHIETV